MFHFHPHIGSNPVSTNQSTSVSANSFTAELHAPYSINACHKCERDSVLNSMQWIHMGSHPLFWAYMASWNVTKTHMLTLHDNNNPYWNNKNNHHWTPFSPHQSLKWPFCLCMTFKRWQTALWYQGRTSAIWIMKSNGPHIDSLLWHCIHRHMPWTGLDQFHFLVGLLIPNSMHMRHCRHV